MGGYSDYVYMEGVEKGIKVGEARDEANIIRRLLANGKSISQLEELLDLTAEEINELLNK